jgi:hypothetical protein
MNRLLISVLVGMLILTGCQEDYFPPGLYGSQVERLLAGTDTLHSWIITDLTINGAHQPLNNCLDSVKVVFLSNTAQTVIEAYDLRYRTGCQEYDSIYYGMMKASVTGTDANNKNIFTDSLLFEEGEVDFLIVDEITPQVVRWNLRDSVIANYRFVLQ